MALRNACTLVVLCITACSCASAVAGGKLPANVEARKSVATAAPSLQPSGGILGKIPIGYHSAPDRTGSYYLPKNWQGRALPVLVVLHGSNGRGYDILSGFKHIADHRGFIIVAPDSHLKQYWFNPEAGQPFTSDWEHVEACYDYVKNLPGVRVNPKWIAYAGFSRGGYAAAALATRVGRATHSLIFHSLITKSQLGRRRPQFWVSTGKNDSLFPASRVGPALTKLKREVPGMAGRVRFQVFSGGHDMQNVRGELNTATVWWLRH